MIRKLAEDGVLGSKLEVDSVANGSTFNTLAGYNTSGMVGVESVAAEDQRGFVLQNIAFEIGRIGGLRRLPAAQTR